MKTCNLSIDPGMNIGWALWEKRNWKDLVPPIRVGSNNGGTLGTWQEKVERSLWRFETTAIFNHVNLDKVFIECPEFEKGKTIKLIFTVGWIARWAVQDRKAKLILVGVNEWKGQLKKQQTDMRINLLLGKGYVKPYNDHTRDAIGIGLHAKGFSFG